MTQVPSLTGTPREWAIDLAIITAVGAFLGVIGPFGSFYGGPAGLRIAYWVANLWIGFIVLSTIVRLSIRFAIRLDLPTWFAIAAGVAVGAVPLAIALAYFSAWVWPPNHGRANSLFLQYGETVMLAEPFSFAYYYLGDRGRRAAVARERTKVLELRSSPDPPTATAGGGFLDRLPPHLGRDLLCLQMEDHYVRAHTAKGSKLILTPLKNAIAELGETEGLQVHRSWWVAKGAVVEPVASGRHLSLRLSNGLEVPISRASVAKLRAAGWLYSA